MTNHFPTNYQNLINTISAAFQQGQQKTYQAINTGLLETYWEIGKHIVEFEQQGSATAEYGAGLLKQLSRDLKAQHGKGFSVSNLQRFRLFYSCFENYATVSHKLTWSHYVELLKISNKPHNQAWLQQKTL